MGLKGLLVSANENLGRKQFDAGEAPGWPD